MCNLLHLVHKLRNKYVLIEKTSNVFLYGYICSRVVLVILLIIPNSEDLVSLIP